MASVLLSPSAKNSSNRPCPLDILVADVLHHEEIYSTYSMCQVTHLKTRDVTGHEFLVLDVCDGEQTYTLRAERQATPKRPRRRHSYESSRYIRAADDCISRVESLDRSDFHEIAVVTCAPQATCSLIDICKVFSVMTEYASDYDLLKQQCYWFCIMFLVGLAETGKVQERPGEQAKFGGKYWNGFVGIIDKLKVQKEWRRWRAGDAGPSCKEGAADVDEVKPGVVATVQQPPKAEDVAIVQARARSLFTKLSDISPEDTVIVLIGPVGAGKSTFIDAAAQQCGEAVGHGLRSSSTSIRAVRVWHPDDSHPVVLIDIPGFDDAVGSDKEAVKFVTDWSTQMINRNIRLAGIIYLHRITDNRVAGTPLKNIRMFTRLLCGDSGTQNVVLATSMWDQAKPDVACRRETELQQRWWQPMLELGSATARFYNTTESAWSIIDSIRRGVHDPPQRVGIAPANPQRDWSRRVARRHSSMI